MAERKGAARIFRFGIFELDDDTGELRREGKAQPKLHDQALQILTMLVERPRQLVTREELRERLWAADMFVDFDHGLNTAINQLRNALGDEAGNPRFIQTLPRRGYRFIAPVEIAASGEKVASAAAPSGVTTAEHVRGGDGVESGAEEPRSTVLSDARDLPAVSGSTAHTFFLLIQLIYLTFYVIALARLREVDALLTRSGDPVRMILVVLIVTAAAGIPIRLYLISAAAFNYRGLRAKFQKLFPFLLPLDELWALAPFLAVEQIGFGVALAGTAALLYLPFAQRSLLLMGRKR